MNDKYLILSIAKKEIQKQLDQAQKRLKRASDKLFYADLEKTTQRARAMMRVKARAEAEERDRWQRRLEIVEEWIEEVRKQG